MTDARNLSAVAWRKSSYSGQGGGNCLEVATDFTGTGGIPVRDSKNPHGPVLLFPAGAWHTFVATVREGGVDNA